jgi:glycosyltransferase involved in cell wall biosynthesis
MKIGYLSERLRQGFGMDLLIHNQANALVDLGHEVTVYTQVHDDSYPNKKYSVVLIDSPLFVNPIKTELFLLKRKLKFFRNTNNDVWISTMYPYHVLLPFLKGKKLVIEGGTVSTRGMKLTQKLSFLYQRYFDRNFFYPFAHKVLPFSKALIGQVPFFLRFKTQVNYIGADHYTKGIELSDNDISSIIKKLNIDNSKVNMVYIGRLNHSQQPYKGVQDLVEIYQKAKKSNPNIQLIMAGFGSEEDKQELENMGIITLTNASDTELMALLKICSFYVSATKWEGFNLPMIEAQSFGKIPIIYNIGPHSELTNSGIDSFVVNSQDEFIEKVLFLSENKEFINKHKEFAIKNANIYTWKNSAYNLEEIIKSIK